MYVAVPLWNQMNMKYLTIDMPDGEIIMNFSNLDTYVHH